MARAQLSIALADFRSVVKEMRELGVASWVDSPVGSVVLGPAPSARATKPDVDPKADRREFYSEVFGRNVTDQELAKLP